jgi:hypothetical protein
MCGTTGVDHVGERAVAVVAVELVRGGEVVRHVEVGPAVAVVVPPDGGMALRLAGDPGPARHVGEGPVAVVVEQVVPLAVRVPSASRMLVWMKTSSHPSRS